MVNKGDATSETLAIPLWMREEVDARDSGYCRLCGTYLGERRALHHIRYGAGTGARREHSVDNLVTICWMYGPGRGLLPCHDLAHSNKGLWTPLLELAIVNHGTTALQLKRWQKIRI